MKKSQHKLCNDICEGLNQAIGATSQLIHARRDMRYLIMREALTLVRDCILKKITCDATKTVIVRKN